MTATDTLRAMLDKRGVKYYASPNGVAWGKLATPIHERMYTHYAVELDGLLCVNSHCITPEQAIAATLGTGTCEADETETIKCWVKCKDEPSTEHMDFIHVMECTECGHTYEYVNGDYEYCPRCGRKRRDFVE